MDYDKIFDEMIIGDGFEISRMCKKCKPPIYIVRWSNWPEGETMRMRGPKVAKIIPLHHPLYDRFQKKYKS